MTQNTNNLAAYIWNRTFRDFPKMRVRYQMMQLLSDPAKAAGFAKVVFDLLKLAK